MSREHLTQPHPLMEICPENSRFSMRFDTNTKEFLVSLPRSKDVLFTLPYEDGRYIYAMLRGQQRIEEMGRLPEHHPRRDMTKDRFMMDMTSTGIAFTDAQMRNAWKQLVRSGRFQFVGGAHPSITHKYVYKGANMPAKEPFVFSEDALKRTRMDFTPRRLNVTEDCHIAARTLVRMSGRELHTDTALVMSDVSYKMLVERVESSTLPLFVEVFAEDDRLSADIVAGVHSFVVLKKIGDDYVCFEKVGNSFPWRLVTMNEIYTMYEGDMKTANSGHTKFYWRTIDMPKKAPAGNGGGK